MKLLLVLIVYVFVENILECFLFFLLLIRYAS